MSTILFVEDARELAQLVIREMEAAGFQVTWVADGKAAVQAFTAKPHDLIILDWMLPGMDGLDVLRHIRQDSTVPVIMLTARSEEMDRVLGLELGADDYLTKPFSVRELLARVKAQLRRMETIEKMLHADRQQESRTLTYGNLELNRDTYQALQDGNPLDLTRTEFELLALLVGNPGRVFNRNYLLETVWEAQYVTGDRAVDNAILRLRRKLGDLGERIELVWGVGYRMRREE